MICVTPCTKSLWPRTSDAEPFPLSLCRFVPGQWLPESRWNSVGTIDNLMVYDGLIYVVIVYPSTVTICCKNSSTILSSFGHHILSYPVSVSCLMAKKQCHSVQQSMPHGEPYRALLCETGPADHLVNCWGLWGTNIQRTCLSMVVHHHYPSILKVKVCCWTATATIINNPVSHLASTSACQDDSARSIRQVCSINLHASIQRLVQFSTKFQLNWLRENHENHGEKTNKKKCTFSNRTAFAAVSSAIWPKTKAT